MVPRYCAALGRRRQVGTPEAGGTCTLLSRWTTRLAQVLGVVWRRSGSLWWSLWGSGRWRCSSEQGGAGADLADSCRWRGVDGVAIFTRPAAHWGWGSLVRGWRGAVVCRRMLSSRRVARRIARYGPWQCQGGIWGGLIGACACVARRLPGSLRIEEIRPAPARSSVRFETALRVLYVYWVARVVLLPLAFRLFFVSSTSE